MSVSLFGSKAGGERYQGIVGRTGKVKFEAARKRLATIARVPVGKVSDGDVMEALARGWADVERVLAVDVG